MTVSQVLPDEAGASAFDTDLAWNPGTNQYLAVWVQPHAGNVADLEIYGRRLAPGGQPVGEPFRISTTGVDGDTASRPLQPAVAANPVSGGWYVAWEAEDTLAGLADNESEIFGVPVGDDGVVDGPQTRLSDMGPTADPAYDASAADVAANPVTGDWLVVWSGDDGVDNDYEIHLQRLTPTGTQTGPDDQQVSWMGDGVDPATGVARYPAVAASATTGEWLVAWQASDKQPGLAANKQEIYTQRLAADAAPIGERSRISTTGDDLVLSASAWMPDLVSHPGTGEWWVTWYADPFEGGLAESEFEIYLQRLTATGAATGTDDQRVSTTGADGDDRTNAYLPRIAADSSTGEVAITWYATPMTDGLGVDENEVFIQRFAPDASALAPVRRVSFTGPDGSRVRGTGEVPALAANPVTQEFFVTWNSAPGVSPYVDDEWEIFGRSVSTKDTAVSGAVVRGRKTQRQGHKVKVAFSVAATVESLTARVVGKVRTPRKAHRLKARTVTVASGSTTGVRLRLARTSSNRAVLRAVRAWRRAPATRKKKLAVKALVRFTFRDGVGNTSTVRRTVRLT